jgi:hypothetical protein
MSCARLGSLDRDSSAAITAPLSQVLNLLPLCLKRCRFSVPSPSPIRVRNRKRLGQFRAYTLHGKGSVFFLSPITRRDLVSSAGVSSDRNLFCIGKAFPER